MRARFFSVKGNFVCQAKGFATAPSGSYALVLLFLLVPVVMVLGATSALTIVALPVQLWLVLALVNASRFTRVGGSKRFKSGKSNRVLVLEKNGRVFVAFVVKHGSVSLRSFLIFYAHTITYTIANTHTITLLHTHTHNHTHTQQTRKR